MRTAYKVAQVRVAETYAKAERPETTELMDRAAAGLASVIINQLASAGRRYGARVLIVAGSGNNGGDALLAGAKLARKGVAVSVVRVGSGVHREGFTSLLRAGGRDLDVGRATSMITSGACELIIDAVVGIGRRGRLTGAAEAIALAANSSDLPVISVDLPSGLDADRGAVPAGAGSSFEADTTVTFGALKSCHLLEPAASRCGEVILIDIGLQLGAGELQQWELEDLAQSWPIPNVTSDKYSRGVVGIDTGSLTYPGAALLGALGAVHTGVGMVRFLGIEPLRPAILQALPNVVCVAGPVQSLLLGSGWADRSDAAERVTKALATGLPTVLDAEALTHLTERVSSPVLLTPHPRELARLIELKPEKVSADPIAAVSQAVQQTGATVLLKGATQYVMGPDSEVVTLAIPGPAWTAQAGSGDVLAGMCAALLAFGMSPATAALAAASLQALTARRHPGPVPPQDLVREFAATGRHHQLW